MKSDDHSAWAPRQGGFTLYPMYFVYALVVVLFFIWGWPVLAVFAVLMLAFATFAYYDDRLQQAKVDSPDAAIHPTPDPDEQAAEGGKNCPVCGSALFIVEPGVTNAEEIQEFVRKAEGWQDNPEALAGWMPPGVYCPKGCYVIHTTPPGPVPNELTVPEQDGIPRPLRIRWADVLRDGGSYVLVYDAENGDTVKVLLRVVATQQLKRTGYRNPQLIVVDPETYEERGHREIDWDSAARLGSFLLTARAVQDSKIGLGGAARASEMIRLLSLRGRVVKLSQP